jgi:hypothetical protein
MIVYGKFKAIDKGTLSLYELSTEGTECYAVYANGEYMTFDNKEDAVEYASMLD